MQTRTILVIDDDPGSCELVGSMLTQRGFKVITATDGLSGIDLARAAQPAVILLDLDMRMPDIDGIDTLKQMKRDPGLGKIPVVGITGSYDLKYTERAFHAGAEFFLGKPFRAQDLIQVLSLALLRAARETHERRRHPRFAVELPTRCLVLEEGEATREVMGHTGNLSLGGVLAWLTEPLALGTVVQLELGFRRMIVGANAKVVWWNDEAAKQMIPHGLQFLQFLDDAGYLQYRHFLSEIAAGTSA